jgi:L-histidine N-alpha-methyltransferase
MQTAALQEVSHQERVATVSADVRAGLLAHPKRLPAWLFYDARGSALFEEITRLPEYYPTRTERAILKAHAGEMVDAAGPPASLVELGAGSASKTRVIISALLARRPDATYMPVDVSPTALAGAARHLRSRFPTLQVTPVAAKYPDELSFLRAAPSPRLVLFLGSNIGNYEAADACALLRAIHNHLRASDTLLLATDLRKDPALLVPAYDDAAGVTAQFNKNVLVRLNRQLGAGFNTGLFRHVARWNARASRMEMHLESMVPQVVPIPALGLTVTLRQGERIHTESSYKYTPRVVKRMLHSAGFTWQRSWSDPRDWFALHLARV